MNLRPHILLLLANSVWGVGYPIYRVLLPGVISPYALAAMTLIVAGSVCMISFLFNRGEKVIGGDIWKFAMAGVLAGVLKKGFLMVGMSDTSPIDASIINTSGPVIVLIISALFLTEKITRYKLLGVILGVGGAITAVIHSGNSDAYSYKTIGGVIIFLGTLSSAFYIVWLKGIVKRYKPITIMRYMYSFAALFSLPVAIATLPDVDFAGMSTLHLWMIAYAVTIPTLIPNYFVISSARYLSPTVVSIYGYAQPVIAVILSVVFGIEVLTLQQVLAAVMVAAGVYFVVQSYQKMSHEFH